MMIMSGSNGHGNADKSLVKDDLSSYNRRVECLRLPNVANNGKYTLLILIWQVYTPDIKMRMVAWVMCSQETKGTLAYIVVP